MVMYVETGKLVCAEVRPPITLVLCALELQLVRKHPRVGITCVHP